MLNIDIESSGGAILARLSGELDRSAREPLLKAVRTEAEANGGKVVLDCANLSSLDSEGVRALLALQTWLRIKDSEMAIAALPARLEDTIKSDPGVDQFLTRYPTVDEALKGLGLPPQGGGGSAAAPADPGRAATPPPARPATPPPVMPSTAPSSPPPETTAPPPAAGGGGWGPSTPEPKPEVEVDPPASPGRDDPGASSPGASPWESPIVTPDPVPSGGPAPEKIPDEPVVSAPTTWGAPVTEPTEPEAQTVAKPTPWAKGPPPRDEKAPGKKSKKGLIIAAVAALVVIIIGVIIINRPEGKPGPATIGLPISHNLSGKVGEVPEPKQVVFSLTNIDLEKEITTIPAETALEKWIEMEVSGTKESCQVTFTFSTVDAIPKHKSIVLEATGLDGVPINGFVNFAIEEPNARLVILEQTLLKGTVDQSYRERLSLDGASGGVFGLAEGSRLPEGLTLLEDGKLTGTPGEAVEDFQFTVKATRGDDEPASRVFKLTIAEAPEGAQDDGGSLEAMNLLQDIQKRSENIAIEELKGKALTEYHRFVGYLFRITAQNAHEHVKPVVTVTFPLGRVAVDPGEVAEQLNKEELGQWVMNQNVRFIVAGFADLVGGHEVNRAIIRARGNALRTEVEKWLVSRWNFTPEAARDRVVLIPLKASDDFENARAAECWLFNPPTN